MSIPSAPLGSLASVIISEAPALLERSLRYEVEGNMLYTQCTVLKGRLEIVKRSISNERDKQQVLLDRLEMIRSMLQDGDHTTFHECKSSPWLYPKHHIEHFSKSNTLPCPPTCRISPSILLSKCVPSIQYPICVTDQEHRMRMRRNQMVLLFLSKPNARPWSSTTTIGP